jgi:hypothetical protein
LRLTGGRRSRERPQRARLPSAPSLTPQTTPKEASGFKLWTPRGLAAFDNHLIVANGYGRGRQGATDGGLLVVHDAERKCRGNEVSVLFVPGNPSAVCTIDVGLCTIAYTTAASRSGSGGGVFLATLKLTSTGRGAKKTTHVTGINVTRSVPPPAASADCAAFTWTRPLAIVLFSTGVVVADGNVTGGGDGRLVLITGLGSGAESAAVLDSGPDVGQPAGLVVLNDRLLFADITGCTVKVYTDDGILPFAGTGQPDTFSGPQRHAGLSSPAALCRIPGTSTVVVCCLGGDQSGAVVTIGPLTGLATYLETEQAWRQSYGMYDGGDASVGADARRAAARAALAPEAAAGCANRANFFQSIINARATALGASPAGMNGTHCSVPAETQKSVNETVTSLQSFVEEERLLQGSSTAPPTLMLVSAHRLANEMPVEHLFGASAGGGGAASFGGVQKSAYEYATNRSRSLVDFVLTRYDIGIDIATARGATYTVPLGCGPTADTVIRLLRMGTPSPPKSTAEERSVLRTFVSVLGAEKDQQQTVMDTRRRRAGVPRPVPRIGRTDAPAARVDLASFLSHCATRTRPVDASLPYQLAAGTIVVMTPNGGDAEWDPSPFWLAQITKDVSYGDNSDPVKVKLSYKLLELLWGETFSPLSPNGLRYYTADAVRQTALTRVIVDNDEQLVVFDTLALSQPRAGDLTRTYPMRGSAVAGPPCTTPIMLLPHDEVVSIIDYTRRDLAAAGAAPAPPQAGGRGRKERAATPPDDTDTD